MSVRTGADPSSTDSAAAPRATADQTPVPAAGRGAWGVGLATLAAGDRVLDVWYPRPSLDPDTRMLARLDLAGGGTVVVTDEAAGDLFGEDTPTTLGEDPRRGVTVSTVVTYIPDLTTAPRDAADAYLRLHLLSHRLVAPRGLSVEGIFGVLSTVVWTNVGPCAVEDFETTRLRLRASGTTVDVYGVDKFPRMTDYVVPTGVRIADADRVRLGAHLAAGTTVMHEGFVNFNAGTLGTSMVEGRISSGVVVGDGSDVGGGASIMGTLSGGGTQVVSIGRRCLLGANSGIGIALGDDCVVEAGCYVTAGSLVRLPDGAVVKARELSGANGLLFRRHSQTGALEAVPRTGTWGGLNTALHAS